jgi:hypothetical protein
MRFGAISSMFCAGLITLFASGNPQVSGTTVSSLRAIGPDASRRQSNPPEAQTSYYANVLPALSGDGNLDRVDAVPGFQFAALKIVISVAPAIFAGSQDISGEQTTRSLGALKHLNSHVTVRPLDASGQIVQPKSSGAVTLATLEVSPSEPTYADRTSNTAAAISTAVNEATSAVKPVSGVIQAFQSSFHRRPATTQVSYMTGPTAFGWRWYESPDQTIEGLHYSYALLQIANEVKTLRITIDLIAEWRAFGLWSRSFEFTYSLAGPPR